VLFPRPSWPRRALHTLLAVTLAFLATTVPAEPISAQAAVDRLSGPDRYATAAAISRATFGVGAPVAFVATGADFPDSLAGGPAAARLGGPILLTQRDSIPAATRTELARLQPRRIAVLGGESVVSAGVMTALGAFTAGGVTRYAGADRYATAAAISRAHFPAGAPVAFIATGRDFADALAAGPAAAALRGPVLLVQPDRIPPATAAELQRLAPQQIRVAGGPSVVNDSVLASLRAYTRGTVSRDAGPNRYATAAAISSANFRTATGSAVFIANGLGFADAVAGVPAAARAGAPLLLSGPLALPAETSAELRRLNPSRVVLLGGPSVLADNVGVQAQSTSTLTLVGPWAFALDNYTLHTLAQEHRIYYLETIIAHYGHRDGMVAKYRAPDGVLYDHPVAQAQYVVNMLSNYRLTGDATYLQYAVANADRLLQRAVSHRDAIFFPYPFDFVLHGRGTMQAPWYSGMAQGTALSGFVRLYELTGDAKWLDAAHRTYRSFLVREEPDKPWVTSVDRGLLWFELYPWTPNDHTYNGHAYATFGLIDYLRLTGSEDVRRLVLGGVTTSARMATAVRVPGGVSNYCLADRCRELLIRNPFYHLVHVTQALYLHRYTGNESFAALADSFVADYPDYRIRGTVRFAAGEHVAYTFDSAGNATPARTATFDTVTTAGYAQRTVPHGATRPGNGIWFFMSDGAFEGLWIRESESAYAPGYVDYHTYLWGRAHPVAGGSWTGFKVDAEGNVTDFRTVETAATSWLYAASARINGQRAVQLTSGPLAGYWLPTTPGATLDPGGGEVGIAAAEEPIPQADESPGRTAEPPVPQGAPIEPPLPGQIDLPTPPTPPRGPPPPTP
jgi:putative cell wall-binding protein